MFHLVNPYSPVEQDFIWLAEYANGSYLSEFDFKTHKENSFYDIDRKSIIRFGLIGCGHKLFYEVYRGIFVIQGKIFNFIYRYNDTNYSLSGVSKLYNDIIAFKNAESFCNLSTGRSMGRITQYNFGYKTKNEYGDGININFQAICQIPYNEQATFHLKLVANKKMDGKLLIIGNGRIIDEYDAPLSEGVGGEITWRLR